MNFTTVNSTLMTCGLSFLPINSENISSDLRAVFIVRIAVSSLTCPSYHYDQHAGDGGSENQTTASHQI